jgi:murein DD-endopeptidase MepM/ murein hydrolase activator NlpD
VYLDQTTQRYRVVADRRRPAAGSVQPHYSSSTHSERPESEVEEIVMNAGRIRWWSKILSLTLLTTTVSLMLTAAPAQAAGPRPLFQLPFACGEVWRLSTYFGHDDYDIDMFATTGETDGRPILASYGGTVVLAAAYDSENPDGGGNRVRIDHGNGWQTRYLHMKDAPMVQVGDKVVRGQQIGRVGRTGDAGKESHLHYEQLRDGHAKENVVESYFNGRPSGITDDATSPAVQRRSFNCAANSAVYGVLSDRRLTYTAISIDTGDRTHGAVVSTARLPFTPKSMATLNFNTILVTSTTGTLYRIDVITNNDALIFNTPVQLGTGWTHDLLTYDGRDHLYGIADGVLLRYPVTADKPTSITAGTRIDGGFTLKTLTGAGNDWLMGTTNAGELLSYRITGPGDWTRYELRSTTWQGFSHLVSPGAGTFYGHHPDGSMHRYLDPEPFDGNGSDLQGLGTVDASGWSQILLSASPFPM